MPRSPRVLIVGGPDVDKRIELMEALAPEFSCSAAGSDPAVAGRFHRAGFSFHPYPLSRRISPLADLRSALILARLIRRLAPDIVHAFATKPCVWGRLAARMAGTPVIVGTMPGLGSLFLAEDWGSRVVRSLYVKLQRLASRSSSLTIFQNRRDYDEMVAADVVRAERATVIPGSGVRADRFTASEEHRRAAAALRLELGLSPDAVVVTMISRVIRSKGVLEFAAAARALRVRCPSALFLLAGPDDRESLDRMTEDELGEVQTSVRWLGERNDVPTLLAASDIFVLPSYYREGIPRVLLEAAASALPIVTTNTPGCREVVEEGGNGLLVPPADEEALADAIERLVRAPELRHRYGPASRALVVRRFELSVVAGATAEHYRRLLGGTEGERMR